MNERWLHEVSFFDDGDADLIELVESKGGEFVCGHATKDDPVGSAITSIEEIERLARALFLAAPDEVTNRLLSEQGYSEQEVANLRNLART